MRMRGFVIFSLAGFGVVFALSWIGATGERATSARAEDAPAAKPLEKPKGPPPLKVDRDAPLLLMDATEEKKTAALSAGPKADNSACYVCHANYDGEELVEEHRIANVGCVKCHGESIAHRNDENNTTPPDIMFPSEAIDSACVKCHETHDVLARKVLARLAERSPGKKNPDGVVCTDCHGHHRLKLRTVRWDKKTGNLIGESGDTRNKQSTPPKP